ncbi:MAG: DUF1127 domain-containing protein [Rhodospirillaceae bacterium]|jgi:uncharacterized protein YjiS (DUF1127 family)|nr:DUF1127 domain-containing protein [Rhodospirillaceae bacterium]MBT5191286.1 DUF1127 domain-containing protein [Rhodospirillaceae bacterium]MBT5896622.1 DUF1127 domain-containing protein [Rhodospirillaceae bacterium]MBT6428706.1 DUF1127 domain-containing protein [Rhodospirillaceae bacterium]MBT7758696.1 DUF1127 domain-containing protein [Rhodospirillaceae bacterium]
MIRTIPVSIREFDLSKILVNAARTLYRWQVRAEQRHRLGELDQHALCDIGITRDQARSEARKPFWWR